MVGPENQERRRRSQRKRRVAICENKGGHHRKKNIISRRTSGGFFGHPLKRRTAEIEQAKRAAKQRDEVCLVCGSVDPWGKCWGPLDGAHLIPINSPFRNWDPADPENIFPLHRSVHSTPGNGSYDENKTLESRRAWIMKRVRKREHRERLIARLEYVYGERESPAA